MNDSESLVVDRLVMEHCNKYVYLGSVFTSDGVISSAVQATAIMRICHVLKFVSFIRKHNDIACVEKASIQGSPHVITCIRCES